MPVSPAVRGVGGLKTPRGFIAARCAIPLLHGDFGEDGTIAGALRSAAIPFVGCDVTASALAADKICTKMIAERLGIPTARWCFGTAESRDADEILGDIAADLRMLACFSGASAAREAVGALRQVQTKLECGTISAEAAAQAVTEQERVLVSCIDGTQGDLQFYRQEIISETDNRRG